MANLNIQISDLRTRITFQESTVTKNPTGAQVTSWANVGSTPTVWSQWINDHGQEAVLSDARGSVQRATVRVRHRDDILESWRVMKGGVAWDILSIDPVQDGNHWVELRVERVKATV